MATVNGNSKKSGAERAVEAQPPVNGPHTGRAKKALAKEKETKQTEDPAFQVNVTARPKDEDGEPIPKAKSYYKPEEIREKARALLKSGKLSSEQRNVLSDILGPEKTDLPQKPARTVEAEKSIKANAEKSRKLDKEV